ncbi:type II secretion system protein GspE [Heliorestis acidaminivorans]|uniref:Type II secretion system protein GspE n=1 Tax=Heliorestis acidaminivorans TaxID=553427 RepID=A0A6I0EW71_9FIRM|nr:ATPase, T2SS/T4P/T4SS family [Heliorestis acidaminivorans]KAB2951308.1 type II secretion system protein GspE [Heliorestis acidaminivorans]
MKLDKSRNFLGTWLINAKVITEEQLATALELQDTTPGKKGLLGQTLIDLGYCTEVDIARAVAARSNIPFVTLEDYLIDNNALTLITPEASKRYKALPIAFENNKLIVVMKYPSDILTIDDLRILTGYDITPVAALDSELDQAIERYGRTGTDFEEDKEDDKTPEIITAGTEESDKPAVQLAKLILSQAVSSKASDVHIEPYEKSMRVRFRLDGVLHDMMSPPRKLHAALVSRIKVMSNMDIANRQIPQDGRMSLKIEGRSIDIRVASLPTSYGERLTLRLLDRSGAIITLEELGVAPELLSRYKEAIKLPYGFILVTGPTGSGKSTTLYASLSTVDRVRKNVITVEDPVEYRLEGMNQIQINNRAGLTFASGLRSILRNDPDIIMIGEIRDKETARIAVESALTGHLVFSTLHTNDAAGAISRLGDMEIEPFLTASSLACVMAQRLARVLCTSCKIPYELSRQEAQKIAGFPLEPGEETIALFKAGKCMRCANTGYRGRLGIYELLFVDENIQRLILERRSTADLKRAAIENGMIPMREDGFYKVKQGITSIEEILRVIL